MIKGCHIYCCHGKVALPKTYNYYQLCLTVFDLRKTISQKCEAVPRRAVFQAHRRLYHSTLGSRVITKKRRRRCEHGFPAKGRGMEPAPESVCLCAWVCMRVCVCWCVFVCARERERVCECVCSREREIERDRERESESERE